MSFGAGYGNDPAGSGEILASEADREAAQAELKQAYEDQRLTLDEFESRVGRAVAARTQGELAKLTRDLPPTPTGPAPGGPRLRRTWLIAGIAVVALAGVAVGLVGALGSGSAAPGGTAAARPAKTGNNTVPGPGGPAGCPVGTSPTAVAIANSLARDPVYVDPASSLLTPAQAQRLRAEIGGVDSGRIRLAVVTNATVRSGGGERALTNAIANCQADAAGVTLVTTATSTFLVTSYADYQATSQAVQAALNIHASLAAGLKDAVRRMALTDPGRD